MIKRLLLWVTTVFACVPLTAFAGDNGLVTIPSNYSAVVTIQRFEDAITARGLKVMFKYDLAAKLAEQGIAMRPRTTIAFGSLDWTGPLLEAPTASIELPPTSTSLGR